MTAWRDMLARFRKPQPSAADALPDRPAVLVAELEESPDAQLAVVAAPPTPLDAADDHAMPASPPADADPELPRIIVDGEATQRLGDTTRSLATSAPQLAALLGEHPTGAAALRDIGRERRENQDHCFAQMLVLPTDQGELALGLFVVADGMGGHHDGGYASKLALTTLVRQVQAEFIVPLLAGERRAPQPIMQAALQTANAAVYEAGQAAGSDMGTTCTATLWFDGDLITAHVGDSRAMLIGSGVKQLSTDHSAVGRLIAIGALTPEEARDHPLRNQLYRSVGQHAEVAVDVTTTPLGDARHVVLCSDGLWGLVPEGEIADIVLESPTPQIAARQLVARANLLGGHDNIAVVVATLPASTGAAL